jgi:hypothetical protein
MKPSLARKWRDQLLSGNYVQTRRELHRVKSKGRRVSQRAGYSALGVLSEIVAHTKVVRATHWKWDGRAWRYPDEVPRILSLPDIVRKKIGLTAGDQQFFVGLNDDDHKSFRQIAREIEKLYLDGDRQ